MKPTTRTEDAKPGDEAVGYWPREMLVAMDERFRERVRHVLAQERNEAATVDRPA